MTRDDDAPITPTNLPEVQERLLDKARSSNARRAAETVYGDRDTLMRHTVLALLEGVELPEHDSPPEATLQVLSGRVRLFGDGRDWTLAAGELIEIPPERHSVTALTDSVFILTVRRAPASLQIGAPS